MSFADSIKAFESKALRNANKSVSKNVEVVFNEVVKLTPTKPTANYSTGLLINSWYAQVGGFDTTVGTTPNFSGIGSYASIRKSLSDDAFLGKDNSITLTNSVDHAYRANYIGWPAGLGTNGWHWTGKVQAYAFVQTAMNNIKGLFT